MSWRVIKLVLDVAPVRDTPLVLMLALAEWSQDDGVSWHPVEAIAERARCSLHRTQEILKRLSTPNENGERLLVIRRAKRTTFYEINLELLLRLDAEKNGQATLWKTPMENLLKDCEEPEDDGGKDAATEPETDGENAKSRVKSAKVRVPTINNRNNRNEPEPENHQPPPLVVEVESVLWIVKKLAASVAFPPPAGLDDRQANARQRFLDSQRDTLRRKTG